MRFFALVSLMVLAALPAARAQRGGLAYAQSFPGSQPHVYKTIGDTELRLHVFSPPATAQPRKHPAIVFFFGGGWTNGSPAQFLQQSTYLASRGLVAIAADYRVASRHHSKIPDSIADAKSAIRWVRAHAAELGVDPDRIAAAGGSAGGHLAAATGVIPGFEEPGEDAAISSKPNAMVLYNPALVLAPLEGNDFGFTKRLGPALTGPDPAAVSPAQHVSAGAPPTIIFHGRADTTVPFSTVEAFADRMHAAGSRCEVIGYDGQSHGFFNFHPGGNQYFRETLTETDRFLASLGWLQGEPQVDRFLAAQSPPPVPAKPSLHLAREQNWLTISGPSLPCEIRINYLEAYCRAGSTDADWNNHTVMPHKSELIESAPDGRLIRIRDTISDGVIVDHTITAGVDEIDFRITAHNPASAVSEVHWAQPCIRLGPFTGFTEPVKGAPTDYLGKCFVFVAGKLTRMPFEPWATEARYTPGQVWCPVNVPRTDVNPRPLSSVVPSNGLIGCYSADEKLIFATAFEPCQELFQGVIRCVHSDFRLGGLAPGETKQIRGKMYIIPANVDALLARYRHDFAEQAGK